MTLTYILYSYCFQCLYYIFALIGFSFVTIAVLQLYGNRFPYIFLEEMTLEGTFEEYCQEIVKSYEYCLSENNLEGKSHTRLYRVFALINKHLSTWVKENKASPQMLELLYKCSYYRDCSSFSHYRVETINPLLPSDSAISSLHVQSPLCPVVSRLRSDNPSWWILRDMWDPLTSTLSIRYLYPLSVMEGDQRPKNDPETLEEPRGEATGERNIKKQLRDNEIWGGKRKEQICLIQLFILPGDTGFFSPLIRIFGHQICKFLMNRFARLLSSGSKSQSLARRTSLFAD